MPVHDLKCPVCGEVFRDLYIPLIKLSEPDYSQGYRRTSVLGALPLCTHGMGERNTAPFTRLEIIPPHVGVDVYESASTTAWIPDGRGGQEEVPIHSLRDIRRAEKLSADRGAPHVWRDYSQDRSNRDQNVHGAYSGEVLSEAARRKFGPGIRKSVEEPVAALGPGVDEASSTQFGDV